jgi:hypothetical protein
MLRLTPEIMAAAYEYLRATPPMSNWKLPPADEVTFVVINKYNPIGTYTYDDGHVITASDKRIGHTHTLLALIAHEIVHMYRRLIGHQSWETHGPEFKKLGNPVCRVHGFDPKEF